MMADTVILLAVVLLAIAAFAYFLAHHGLPLFARLNSFFSFVILASRALAGAHDTCQSLLEAHTIELATLTTLTVASLDLIGVSEWPIRDFWWCLDSQTDWSIRSHDLRHSFIDLWLLNFEL